MDETIERLARIETKVDVLVERGGDHENRIRAVERKQWYHTGGLAVIAIIATKLGIPGFHVG